MNKHRTYKNLEKALEREERSLRWLSRKLGTHYQTVLKWKLPGIPFWWAENIAKALNSTSDNDYTIKDFKKTRFEV